MEDGSSINSSTISNDTVDRTDSLVEFDKKIDFTIYCKAILNLNWGNLSIVSNFIE